ncbi:MAG: hypothetical protein J0H27_08940 [Xanthomonadales bacterium]|nr:hypothetical protein [Xanthomonadales bacterium]ODU93169.1 MAG: hypothetical protein ABT18_08780 [Rhodanobacter sp. SCN 66-43]OJY82073.1 MAG: hypothetical protein BGP23_00590 [Xanthomonadales bacterium 66-474]
MNERLREINRSLHTLDEAHRLGRISREDYRARRRHLLGMLCDGGGITARNTVAAETVPRSSIPAAPAARPARDEAVSAMFPWWSRLFSWLGRRH